MNEFGKFENSQWLNRIMNTTPYQGERKVKEQKMCGEGGHSWACKCEVTISLEQCMKSTFFFLTLEKDHMNNKKLRMLNKYVCKNMILPAVLKSRLHIFFALRTCHPNVVSQLVNSAAGASGGISISDSVVLCCHCITNSVSTHFPLRVW